MASTSTKITAAPIPTAVDVFLEVPKNGQIPRNCAKMTLLTKIVDIRMIMIFMALRYLVFFNLLTIAMR